MDRRERELQERITSLRAQIPAAPTISESSFAPRLPKPLKGKAKVRTMDVWRILPGRLGTQSEQGFWLVPGLERSVSKNIFGRMWWWLPPVIWPEEEQTWATCLEKMVRLGARQFVLGAPWQRGLFAVPERCSLWAGPMCNVANSLAVDALAHLGFSGAFVSPELDREGLLGLPAQSPLPLGVVARGIFPVCVSRIRSEKLREREPLRSPKGEEFWSRTHGQLVWTFPGWELDLSSKWAELEQAGYALLTRIHEPVPEKIRLKTRQGLWNWDLKML